jgi:hypothetical protein
MLHEWAHCLDLFAWSFPLVWARGAVNESGYYLRKAHAPQSALPRLEPCVLDHPHGEGVRRDVSRLHPGRRVPSTGGSFEYAHVLSHMSEMGGAGISAL